MTNKTNDHAGTDYAALPVFTVDQIANQLTTGYWTPKPDGPRQFLASTGDTITVDITGLSSTEQTLATQALQSWTDATGLIFEQVTDPDAQIFFRDDEPGSAGNTSTVVDGFITQSVVSIAPDFDPGTTTDSYMFQTYIHEIGHALGLGHAGNYNGTANYITSTPVGSTNNYYLNDSWQLTVMSYFDPVENTYVHGTKAYDVTPMVADLIAIQSLYGTPTDVRTDDTTYWENSTAGGYLDTLSGLSHAVAFTITDADGIDTVDFHSVTANQRIDLREEKSSDVAGSLANMWIARNTVIENAISGSGDDDLTGNDADNEFTGNGGNDTMDGGGGDDRAIYSGLRDDYTITFNDDGTVTIAHTGGSGADGTDTLKNFETAVFVDEDVPLNPLAGPFDVVFLQDLTGSFGDDLPFMQDAADDVASRLLTSFPGTRFAVTSFRDEGDSFVYRVDSDFTASPETVGAVYATLEAGEGGDLPEAQLTALLDAANGDGLSYEDGRPRIFILATDASFHDYVSIDTLRELFETNHIIPIFATTEGAGSYYQDLVDQLGVGVVVEISSSSDDFSDAIRYAIADLSGEVTDAGSSDGDDMSGDPTRTDRMYGLGGDDSMYGLGGRDEMDGGSGDDAMDGGSGGDSMRGGSGADSASGGSGNDKLEGNEGDDNLNGDGGIVRTIYTGVGVLDDTALSGNDSVANARSIDGLFNQASNDDIAASTHDPHVSIEGGGDETIRYYKFTVVTAGTEVTFDIDHTNGVDTYVELYTADGTFLDYDDDSDTTDGAEGSTSNTDSFFTHTFDAAGQYVIAVGAYSSGGAVALEAADRFTLHVSVAGAVIAPTIEAAASTPGNDTLMGGDGNDTIDGGGGIDTADYSDKRVQVIAQLVDGAATVLIGTTETDTISHIENITGGSAGDILSGDAGSNWLKGNSGEDTLRGGLGLDTLTGGEGGDIADYRDQTGKLVITLNGAQNGSAKIGGATLDVLQQIEAAWGGSGKDKMFGDANANLFRGGLGKDTFDGGAGRDAADYSEKAGKIEVTLAGAKAAIVFIDGVKEDKLLNVEAVLGGKAADSLTGDGKANFLSGARGNDVLSGVGGGDGLDGGNGRDSLDGGGGKDSLFGGLGKDQLTGGDKADQFVFDTALGKSNVDTITDFTAGTDKIRLDDAIFTAIGTTLDKAEFYAHAGATAAHDLDDRIIYDKTTGKLYFDADGKDGALAVQFATLSNLAQIHYGDFAMV